MVKTFSVKEGETAEELSKGEMREQVAVGRGVVFENPRDSVETCCTCSAPQPVLGGQARDI